MSASSGVPVSANPPERIASRIVRIVILLVTVGGIAAWARSELLALEKTIAKEDVLKNQPQATRAPAAKVATEALDSMGKQSDLLLSWALAILAGATALWTTTKVHPIPGLRYLYLLTAAAAALAATSLLSGLKGLQRLAYLRSQEKELSAEFMPGLIGYLGLQNEALWWATLPLLIFGAAFLIAIVWGTTSPTDRP